MSQKDDPELVTSGPYHLVRHPIYSGILIAGVGTALALSWFWLIAVALAGVYFAYSATIEERNMAKQFPESYPAYRRSTKMLVPFVSRRSSPGVMSAREQASFLLGVIGTRRDVYRRDARYAPG